DLSEFEEAIGEGSFSISPTSGSNAASMYVLVDRRMSLWRMSSMTDRGLTPCRFSIVANVWRNEWKSTLRPSSSRYGRALGTCAPSLRSWGVRARGIARRNMGLRPEARNLFDAGRTGVEIKPLDQYDGSQSHLEARFVDCLRCAGFLFADRLAIGLKASAASI